MTKKRRLEMRISLTALEHLGMNLYSNIPAVLSEIVANAWDADANLVEINIDKDKSIITIQDDGIGMNRNDVIDKFLNVGFKRRTGREFTDGGRKPMGRKGIGKLSIFSIAQVAKVYTIRAGEQTAFSMDREIINEFISKNEDKSYKPVELKNWPKGFKKGTRIVLSDLAKNLSTITVNGLKRRVARRFSIIGEKHKFLVKVNGTKIKPEDRGYHNTMEYLWTYGSQDDFLKLCKNLGRTHEDRTRLISKTLKKYQMKIGGWIGSAKKSKQLRDEEGDNLNRIAIFMRGKMAQEDVLDEFGLKGIFADYIIGELHCEELDIDNKRDIATSSRQSLKQDDYRFEAVRNVVHSELRYIAGKWSNWRVEDGAKIAQTVPQVLTWLEGLQGDTKKKAEKWVGRLNTIRTRDDSDKKELLKASILAFESYRRKEQLDSLDSIKDESLDQILAIFKSIDDLELSYYGQIVKLRIGVIKTLEDKLNANEKEHAIRDYVFEHLWLLV